MLKRLLNRGPAIAGYETSKTVASSDDVRQRRKLAPRDDARPEILYYLAEDEDTKVRRAVASNPTAPRQADLILAEDRDDDVRCELARKIGRLAPNLPRDAADKLARLTLDVLEKLVTAQLPRVRQIVADEVKHCDNLPRGLIRRLAMDAELAVAGPVLEYSPLLSDADLREIIDSDPVRGALGAVARRGALGESVCEAIAESEDDDAIVDLLANKGAQIREEMLDRLIARAPPKEACTRPWCVVASSASGPWRASPRSSPSRCCARWRNATTCRRRPWPRCARRCANASSRAPPRSRAPRATRRPRRPRTTVRSRRPWSAAMAVTCARPWRPR